MTALEDSERLIFRSAVLISETDMTIERSRRLIRNKGLEKAHATIAEVCTVGSCISLPTVSALHPRNDQVDTMELSVPIHHARILIIDDDAVLLTALADTLKIRLGHIVIDTANSGADGLAQVESHRYNIILCDISMPDLNGLALLPRLKKIAPDSAIIMTTADGEESTRRTAARLGALALIQKPFDRPALVRTLKQALQGTNHK